MPRLALLTTGGTIAGTGNPDHYTAATLDAQTLFGGVPELKKLAEWHVEEVFSLDSRDLLPAHWVILATRIQVLQADPQIDGIVITHGTDTLEETAYALHLMIPVKKPVVITAAMRPADSPDADGPGNLLQAARVALDVQASSHGVLVAAHGLVIHARDIRKTHTSSIAALCNAPETSPAAVIKEDAIDFFRAPGKTVGSTLSLPNAGPLPRVDILYAYAGVPPDMPQLCVEAGASGLVLALTGHGSIPDVWRKPLAAAMQQGIPVIRGSRISAGGVLRNHNENDADFGCLPAGRLSPQQARVLLILCLANRLDVEKQFSLRSEPE